MDKSIPKKIHYCWFGGNKLPEEMKRYIAGWRQLCPDYEIIEWNEENFDLNSCEYVKEAYSVKKWAFVSDYARFKILYEYGGVYFDTDVELLKNLDNLLRDGPFLGMEYGSQIAPGLGMAAYPKMKYCEDMLELYDNIHFINENGTINLKTICQYTTEYFMQRGFMDKEIIQKIDDIVIYPKEYFNPCDLDTGKIIVSENTVSIHHYAGTWVDPYSKFRGKVYFLLRKIFGEKGAEAVRRLLGRKEG